ncbi:TonB-dependent receptor [Microbulbifer sp. SAOS-129_SWC]|uniref:TonB-dependent receptor domain-containing protein n=1 Tax=Microbulbifer sp. SAOS-129_SWC TaxID=3145235 RepID=UPI003217F679
MFEKNRLSMCVATALLGLVASMPLAAEEQQGKEQKSESKEQKKAEEKSYSEDALVIHPSDKAIETIQVTGSLIPRTSFDGPDPMTVIGEEEMKEKGLLTVADVIDSLSENSGYREGDAGNLLSGFTVGASEANLRGLGAGRTLVLVNGRRIADYPLPFGGEQNGVDLGTIPSSALSRVEVLSGSASAIYGSDAVGGVINLITKRDMEQTMVSHTTGIYEEGYGMVNTTSFTTGKAFERGSVTFSLENLSTEPVYANDVSFLDDRKFMVSGISVSRQDLVNTANSGPASPAGYSCEANGLITTQTYGDDGRTVCNYDASSGIAMASQVDRTSMFVDGRYQLTDNISAFATVLTSKQDVASSVPANSWSGFVMNTDGNKGASITRSFAHDLGNTESTYDQEMWTVMLGVQGDLELGGNTWNWDLGYSKARFNVTQKYAALREEVLRDWILDGASDYTELGPNTYMVDNDFYDNSLVDNIFRDASQDREALMGTATTFADSSAQSLTAKVVGDLSDFGVLYNPVTVAISADWSSQSTGIDPDERSRNLNGNGWLNVGAIEANGSRDRTAIGAEFLVPVTEDLELTLATRMDRYDDSSAIGGRSTSTMKFVYSPFDMLKFRGHLAQTFRAPDMFNIYGESTGFASITDLLGGDCYDGENFTGVCPGYTVTSIRRGSQELDEEKGKDIGFGIVFNPTNHVNLSADWYKVRLNDLVLTESAFGLMSNEWQCATGGLPGGSKFCQDVNDRIIRDETGRVDTIIIEPQNQEYRELQGLDVRMSTSFESAKFGRFGMGMNYVNTLSHEWLQFAGDEPIDLRNGQPGQSLPATRTSLNFSWSNPLNGFRSIGAGLFIQRQGRVDNFVGTKKLEPYYTANLTVNYKASARMNLGLTIQNLTNAMPITDETNPYWPYYWSHLQSPMGRNVNLSFSYFLSN